MLPTRHLTDPRNLIVDGSFVSSQWPMTSDCWCLLRVIALSHWLLLLMLPTWHLTNPRPGLQNEMSVNEDISVFCQSQTQRSHLNKFVGSSTPHFGHIHRAPFPLPPSQQYHQRVATKSARLVLINDSSREPSIMHISCDTKSSLPIHATLASTSIHFSQSAPLYQYPHRNHLF